MVINGPTATWWDGDVEIGPEKRRASGPLKYNHGNIVFRYVKSNHRLSSTDHRFVPVIPPAIPVSCLFSSDFPSNLKPAHPTSSPYSALASSLAIFLEVSDRYLYLFVKPMGKIAFFLSDFLQYWIILTFGLCFCLMMDRVCYFYWLFSRCFSFVLR